MTDPDTQHINQLEASIKRQDEASTEFLSGLKSLLKRQDEELTKLNEDFKNIPRLYGGRDKYAIVYVDGGAYAEIPPQIQFVYLTKEEFKEMEEIVNDFEATRAPYFYPQMYLFKLHQSTLKETAKWISELKDEVIEWKKKKENDC